MSTMPEYRKLDPTVKAVWVAALRSGDYHQGKKQLGKMSNDDSSHKNDAVEFCCLGVLAITTPETSKTYWKEKQLCIPDQDQYTGWDEVAQLPLWLGDIYGLDDDAQNTLTEQNDRGESFEMIADWIEEHL